MSTFKNYIDNLIITSIVTTTEDTKTKAIMREVYHYMAKNSDDPTTWTGAALVSADQTIVLQGCNKAAPGVTLQPEHKERPLKYKYIDHAERQVLYKAARMGLKTEGLTMYMPWLPCTPCANAIISSGINELIMHYENLIKSDDHWLEDLKIAIDLLTAGQVKLTMIQGTIGDCEHRYSNELWLP